MIQSLSCVAGTIEPPGAIEQGVGQIRERETGRSCLGWTCPRSSCTANIPYRWICVCQVPQHRKGSHHRDGTVSLHRRQLSRGAFAGGRVLGFSGTGFGAIWCVATVHLQQFRDAETWFVTSSRDDRSKWCRRCKCSAWRIRTAASWIHTSLSACRTAGPVILLGFRQFGAVGTVGRGCGAGIPTGQPAEAHEKRDSTDAP